MLGILVAPAVPFFSFGELRPADVGVLAWDIEGCGGVVGRTSGTWTGGREATGEMMRGSIMGAD